MTVNSTYSLHIKVHNSICIYIQDDTAGDKRVMDVMEKATPDIIKYYLGTLTQKERVSILKYTEIY